MLQCLKAKLCGGSWPYPWPRTRLRFSGSGRSGVCEPPRPRKLSKRVTVIVLLGAFRGEVFQVPFRELLLQENNDYFREVLSVNNIPQVSGFPAPLHFSFDDGSSF